MPVKAKKETPKKDPETIIIKSVDEDHELAREIVVICHDAFRGPEQIIPHYTKAIVNDIWSRVLDLLEDDFPWKEVDNLITKRWSRNKLLTIKRAAWSSIQDHHTRPTSSDR